MRKRRIARVSAVLLAVLVLVAIAWVWRDPYTLVRGEFTRQRLVAGLSRGAVEAADHRWVDARRQAAQGDAPVIVMIHGYTGSKENWYPLATALGRRYSLRIPDLPGWGDSQRKPGQDYGFSAQAGRVADYIRQVSPDAPVVLLGHSMGGGIAALVAARHPQLVARVGLLDAAGIRFLDNQFGRDVQAGGNPFAVEDAQSLQRYLDIVFHDRAAKPWIPWPASAGLIRQRRAQGEFEQQVLTRIGRSEESFLPGEEAARIRQPALLLWCRQDAVIDASALELYAQRVPQAHKVLLEGCGHMSMMEQPQAVADAVVALIEEGRGR